MRGYLLLRGAIWVIFCGGIVLFAAAVTHAEVEPSLWIREGSLTKTLLEDNVQMTDALRRPECTSGNMDVLDRVTSSLFQIPNIKPVYQPIFNDCWRVQLGGMYADNGVSAIQLNSLGSMLRLGDAYYSYTLAGDKVIKFGGGSMRYYSSLRVIPNPLDAASIPQRVNSPITIQFDSKPENWQLMDPGTSVPMNIKDRDISPNGAWLVVESTWGLIRVNLDTKEMIPFDTAPGLSFNRYGFTISNDGRYVIVSESGSARIYDIALCNMNGISGRKIATGCGRRDLGSDLKPSNATTELSTIRFNALGDGFTYYAKENNVWKHYSISAPGQAEHGIDYLALGDSYTSGEGDGDGSKYYLPGTDGDGAGVPIYNTGISKYPYSKEKCHISSRSYPYLLAGYAQLRRDGFRSVACSGADANDVGNTKTSANDTTAFNGHFDQLDFLKSDSEIGNIKNNAVNNFIPGRAAQIEFVAKYKPKVLTIGLSGNDIDFGGKLTECLINLEDTCRYATIDTFETIRELKDNVYTRFGDLLRKIKAASPTTRIYAVGYPQLIGTGACNSNVQLDSKEQAYVRATLSYLNDTIEAAAARAGVNYLDIEHALDGTNLCSDQKYPAINGLTKGNDMFGVIGNESYHPNEQGHSHVADAIKSTMKNQSIVDYSPCASTGTLHCNMASAAFPQIPEFFRNVGSTTTSTTKVIRQILITDKELSDIVTLGGGISMSLQDPSTLLSPNSDVYVLLKSTPVNLSPTTQLKTDATGGFTAQLQIPADTKLGIHTLHLIGTSRSGEPVDYYQRILVVASMDDYDGDGIPNDQDACQFVTPSGIDSDNDGIDDACEGDLRPHTKPVVVDPPVAEADDTQVATQQATSPATISGHIFGAVTVAAMSPYQGPVAPRQSITAVSEIDEDGTAISSSQPKTSMPSKNVASESIWPKESSQSHNEVKNGALPWYVAGSVCIVAFGGWLIYRVRQ